MMMYFVVVVMDFLDVRFFSRPTEEKSPNASRAKLQDLGFCLMGGDDACGS
jgi:hypothetical protein